MDPEATPPQAADEAAASTDEATAPSDPVQPPADPAAPVGSRQAALSEPSITLGGSSTATATGTSAVIDGGTEPASYALVSYRVATGAMNATAQFTVNPAPRAAFQYLLTGTGGGYSSRHLRLQRAPESDALQAVTTTGTVTCGALPSGQPTTVTLAFDGTAKTFNVLIGGAATPCTGLSTKAAGPVVGFRMTDETMDGYGGHVEFSNLTLMY